MAYLDHNATSPLRPEAEEAAGKAFVLCGNASSIHAAGRAARALIEDTRLKVAMLAEVRPDEVIFTSGGTEANALAIWGAVMGSLEARASEKNPAARITRLFVSAIEHSSVLANAAAVVERFAGIKLETIPVQANGVLDLDALRDLLREGKGRALVAVMAANNETGVVQPVADVIALAHAEGALVLADSVQAAGKMKLPLADYVTLSAHKLGGLQGCGALVLRGGAPYAPLIAGGGQERGARAGTENVPGIAAFGAVAKIWPQENVLALRDRFEAGLRAIAQEIVIFGEHSLRIANTSNFSLPGIPAETALMALDLDGVMLSSGAACSSGKVKRSHVLAAMGINDDVSRCALRASFGWNSTGADVDGALASISKLVARLRVAA